MSTSCSTHAPDTASIERFTFAPHEIPNADPLRGADADSAEYLLSWGLLQTYGKQLLLAEQDREPAVLQTLPERLATWLLHQSGSQPGWISGLSYQMVADELGTYRETVAAILRAFMRRGFVKIDYGRIHIVDVDGLADLADSPHW